MAGCAMAKHTLPRVPTNREAWHSDRPRISLSYNAAMQADMCIDSSSTHLLPLLFPAPQVEAMHHALLGLADVFTSEIGESRADCLRRGLINPVNRLRQRKRSLIHLPP